MSRDSDPIFVRNMPRRLALQLKRVHNPKSVSLRIKIKGSRGDGGLSFLRMEEVLGSSRKR